MDSAASETGGAGVHGRSEPVRVAVLTTRDVIRRGLASILMDSDDLQLIENPLSGPADDPVGPADVMVVDTGGETLTVLEGARRLRRRAPRLPAVILGTTSTMRAQRGADQAPTSSTARPRR